MLIEEALKYVLSTNAGVSALAADRIYGNVLKQNTLYPAIAFRLRSREHPVPHLEPRSSSGMARSRFAIFSAAESYEDVKPLDEAIRLALQGYNAVVTIDSESLEIQGIFALTSMDFYDDSTETHQVMSEFDVVHEEVQPT